MDLVIRTSGESRLSDFLLLQSSTAYLHFADALWPDISFFDILDAFASYQKMAPDPASLRAICTAAGTAQRGNACSATEIHGEHGDRRGSSCNGTWTLGDSVGNSARTCACGPFSGRLQRY